MNDLTLADKFPPIHSQKGLLSCVPIAFCDAVWWEIQRGRVPGVSKEFKPSVQFVYYNARKREGDQNSNAPVPPSAVMEALKERGILRRNAPHLVEDLAFIVPSYAWWESPFYGIGLKVYDMLAGRFGFGRSKMLSAEKVTAEFKNGVLEISVPKTEQALPKKITID